MSEVALDAKAEALRDALRTGMRRSDSPFAVVRAIDDELAVSLDGQTNAEASGVPVAVATADGSAVGTMWTVVCVGVGVGAETGLLP